MALIKISWGMSWLSWSLEDYDDQNDDCHDHDHDHISGYARSCATAEMNARSTQVSFWPNILNVIRWAAQEYNHHDDDDDTDDDDDDNGDDDDDEDHNKDKNVDNNYDNKKDWRWW